MQAHLKNPDYSNESVVEYFEKYLKTISRETVSATVQLSSEQRMSFIEMTPLLFCVEKDCVDWRTLTHLTIEADVLIGMENSLTYTMNGDYQIPDLKLTEQPEKPLGKYGRMRKAYLKEHRPLIYNQLLLTEKLYPHLIEIDETAQSRLEQMMPQLAKDAGATEQLKASDPMRWVGLMNTCKAQAEEILMAELIHS